MSCKIIVVSQLMEKLSLGDVSNVEREGSGGNQSVLPA